MNRTARILLPLLALTLLAAPGCSENPVGTTDDANNFTVNTSEKAGLASYSFFTIDARHASLANNQLSMSISGALPETHALVSINLDRAEVGTFLPNRSVTMTLNENGEAHTYSSNNRGYVTITDPGMESGRVKGSYKVEMIAEQNGAQVPERMAWVEGDFNIPVQR